MKKLIVLINIFFLLISYTEAKSKIKFIAAKSETDKRNNYYVDLVDLIFDKINKKSNSYELEAMTGNISQARIIAELKMNRDINLLWTMTSIEREEELLPIRIPLIKGLLGHRVFIIKKSDIEMFNEIQNFDQLRTLFAGQEHDWPDTTILRANKMNVATGPHYENLFTMLMAGRFDYFPRGISEPWQEIINYGKNSLVVEKNLMLRYPAPIYFFVNKNKTELARQIESILNELIDSGEFDKFFYTHPQIIEMFKLVDMPNRTIFELDNPLLSEESKRIIRNKKYWYKQGDENKYIK